MPEDVKFSISLPDGRQTEWDQKQYNKAAQSLFEKYPDAQVNRISGYSDQSELTPDSSFHITLDDGRETDWNYDQFSKAGKSLMEKYPGAKISVSDDITARRNRDFVHQYEYAQSKVADPSLTTAEKKQYEDFVGTHSDRYEGMKDRYGDSGEKDSFLKGEDTEPVTGYFARLKQNTKRMWGDILYGVGELMDINSRSYTGPSKVDTGLAKEALSLLEDREKKGEKSLQLEELLKGDTSKMSPEEKEEYNHAIDVERYLALRAGASKNTGSAKDLLTREVYGDVRAKEIKEKGAKIQDENSQEGKGIAAKAADLTYLAGSGLAAIGATALGQPEIGAAIGNAAFASFAASSAGSSMRAARDAGATDEETVAAGTASAAIMYLVGRIPFLKNMKIASRATSTKAAQAMTEALSNPAVKESVMKEAGKLTKEAAEALGMTTSHYIKQILGQTASSSATFAAMNGMEALVPFIYANPEEYPVLNQVTKSVAEGAIDGAIMGALFGGVSSGSEYIARRNHIRSQMAKNGGVAAAAMDLSKGEARVWNEKTGQFEQVETPPEAGWGEILGVQKGQAQEGEAPEWVHVLFNGKYYTVKSDAIARETVTLFTPKDLDKASRDAFTSEGETRGREADTPLLRGAIRQEKDYLDRKAQYEESNGGVTETTQLDIDRNNAALEGRRDATLSEIVNKVGRQQFWKAKSGPDNSVINTVDVVTFEDGSQGYVVSEDEFGLAVVSEKGKNIISKDDPQITNRQTYDLNEYLDSVVAGQDSAAETERMSSAQADNLAAVQERLVQEGKINVGTEEAPIIGTLVDADITPTGGAYLQVEGEKETRFVPWKEVASSLGMSLDAKTDAQIADDRLSGEVKAREYNKLIPMGTEFQAVLVEGEEPVTYQFKRAFINEDGTMMLQVTDKETGKDEQITEEMALQGNLTSVLDSLKAPEEIQAEEVQTEEEAPQEEDNTLRDFRGNPIPLKDDGSVNQTALWNADPEAWARWNDSQRNDGGANSRGYIAKATKKLQSDAKAVQKQIDKELDFDRISQLEGQLGQISSRIADLERIENNYANAEVAQTEAVQTPEEAPAPVAETTEAAPVAEAAQAQGEVEAAPEVQEEAASLTPEQALESRLAEAQTPEEKRQALEEYYALTTTDPTVVGTRADILQRMAELGYSERVIGQVRDQLNAEGTLTEGFHIGDMVFIVADDIRDARRARLAHLHEHWHEVNRQKGYQKVVASIPGATTEYLLAAANKMAGVSDKNGYGDYLDYPNPQQALADEVIALSMEVVAESTPENVDDNLRNAGLDNQEIINFVKTIYNGERGNDQTLDTSGRDTLSGDNAQEGERQDGGDSASQPEGNLGEQGSGSGEGSDQGTEGAGGEVTPQPDFRVAILDTNGIAANGDEVRFSVRYIPQASEIDGIAQEIADQVGVSTEEARRWIQSETSLAAIITSDSAILDYEGDDRYTAIKQDADYPQGTVDFNNICRKRLAFTEMYQRVQKAFPNTIITGEDLATIRNIMKDRGLTVACGLCYVEDRRQLLGEIAKDFIDSVNSNFEIYASRGGETKKKNAEKFRKLIGEDSKADLSVYDLITLEGSGRLLREHPGLYRAFQAFNNARGQQAGNLFQGYAEYKREILKWNKKKVKSVNDNGGLRIFSYSDFEAHHLIDLVQIIQDCARKGVKIQGYTKVPAFARAVAQTGVKLNRSLIPLGDTGIVDGKLAYDSVEGIDINDPNFLPSNDNIGNILIGINDEQIRLAMADPFINFIIPYHSNQKDILRSMKQTGAWTNYKYSQTEKDANGRTAENVNIYTDVLNAAEAEGNPITNERQFTEKFLAVCKERGLTPRFAQFLDQNENGDYVYTPGYYKFLVDFKLFDEQGNLLPQNPVKAIFDDEFNAQILNDYVKDERQKLGENLDDVYNEIVQKLNLKNRKPDIELTPAQRSVMNFIDGKVSPIETANATQKQPASEATEPVVTEEDVMFRLSKNNKATVESWLKKREDLNDEQRAEVVDYIDKLDDAKTQLATAKWFANGTIRIPEDMKKVQQAISVAGKAKVDPLRYNSPMELLDAHAEFKPSEERINPDEVSTLHRAAEYPEGIVVYDVDNTKESRENMRKIINTHFGEDASPWCLLQGDGKGNLTPDSARYWRHYNAYPKQVAFKDGKLLAFSANDTHTRVWWDRKDQSHYGIPITKKIDGDELGRSATYILSFNTDVTDTPGELSKEAGSHLFRGNRQNGVYEEWSTDGSQILIREHYKNGLEDGLSEAWFPNGQIERRAEMKDGDFVGHYESWYDNGQQQAILDFTEEGYNNGERKTWWKNGNPRSEGRYKKGLRVGEHRSWDEEGFLTAVQYYSEDSDYLGFEDHNRWGIERKVTFTEDNGQIDERYYRGGRLVSVARTKNGKLEGLQEYFYADGVPQTRSEYSNGERNGIFERYHPNGKLMAKGEYKNGEREGIHELYDKYGDLISRQEYHNDEKVRELPLDENVQFRLSNSEQMDQDYMAAVEAGDMDTAQRMVDEMAEAAGYTIRGYHGTTHDFTIFDRSKGNAEGNWGRGFYFTNNEDDAEANYAGEGPDLTNRVELLAENMEWMDGYEDMDYDQRLEEARKQLVGENPHTISAAIKMENPVIFDSRGGQQETYFDYNENYNEETDEYEGDPTGRLVDFVEAWNDVLSEWEWEGNNVSPDEILEYANYEGLTASQLEEKAREILAYVETSDGQIATGEFLRQVFERMGFDGIVDNNVNQKFGTQRRYGRGMDGMDYGTTHVIAFNSNQIKQTDPVTYDDEGKVIPLSKRFDSWNDDIRFRKAFDSVENELGEEQVSVDNPDLMNEYGLSNVTMTKKGDVVTLNKVVVTDQKKGNGTRFMQDFTQKADKEGWTLALTPDDSFGATSISRLKKFYKRFGFKENKGKNADLTINESMIRKPEEDVRFRKVEPIVDEKNEELFEQAKKTFGVTKNLSEAGYVIPDGSMLDFSGRHLVDPNKDSSWLNGGRTVDHRDISDLNYEKDLNTPSGYETDMSDFIRRGAIRLNSGVINLATKPTSGQENVLWTLIQRANGDVDVDFGDGYDSDHYASYNHARPERILNDIRRYFDEGIEPEGNVMFRKANQTQNGFISNAEMALDKIKMEKATPEQWLKMLEKEGGLKAGEDKWLGLSDWLKESDKKTLTKDEIGDFVEQNRIQIEEVHYSEAAIEEQNNDAEKALERYRDEYEGFASEWRNGEVENSYNWPSADDYAFDQMVEKYGEDFRDGFEIGAMGQLEPIEGYDDDYSDAAKYFLGIDESTDERPINSVRLDYTTPGLSNKAEIALTVPTIDPWNEGDKIHFGDAGEGRAVAWIRFGDATSVEAGEQGEEQSNEKELTPEQRERLDSLEKRVREAGLSAQASTNQEELDLAEAALREAMAERDAYKEELGLNERPVRTAPQGRRSRVLVIDEIQSKRHQEGRESGYADATKIEALEQKMKEASQASAAYIETLKEKYDDLGWVDEMTEEEEQKVRELDAARITTAEAFDKAKRGIPAAPFEKNWHELAMKRMLRLAAEEGYDKIAWTTGDQQAERYNLGGVVNKIESTPNKSEGYNVDIVLNKGDVLLFNTDKEGTILSDNSREDQYVGKNLSDVVGKDIAKRILDSTEEQTISGDGLRVGGEGMRGFYDDILPRFMNKYGKKWGVKVQDVALSDVYDETGHPLVMHSVDVTPEMKESVMEGQVMFSLRGIIGAENAEDEAALDNLEVAEEMENAGKDSQTIWRATGWERGADGKWRNEIPDAKQKEGVSLQKHNIASEVLDAPELFASYPQLAEIPIDLANTVAAGAYSAEKNRIVLDTDYNTKESDGQRQLTKEGIRTILHELQHAIQHIEGFAKGTNAKQGERLYYRDALKSKPEETYFAWFFSRKNSARKLNQVGRSKVIRFAENYDQSNLTEQDKEYFRNLINYLKGISDDEFKKFVSRAAKVVKTAEKAGEKSYENSAGEVEARNVERRSTLSDEKRQKYSPEITEEVSRNEQEVRFRRSQELVSQSREGGLAGVIGDEDAAELYRNVYRAIPKEIREGIVDRAGDGFLFSEATQNAIAEAVEKGDETGIAGLAANMLRDYVGDLDERTARYILWRGDRKAEDDDMLDTVKDITMQRRLQVGQFADPVMFRLSDNLEEAENRADSMADDAKATLNEKKEFAKVNDALTTIKAMSLQKEYDRKTVNTITVLAKNVLKDQSIETLSRHEIARLLGIITTSIGKAPKTVKKNADALVGLIVDHQMRSEETKLGMLANRKATKTNQAGVEVQGELDVRGQNILRAYKAGLDMDIENPDDEFDGNTIKGRLSTLSERLSSSDDAVRSEAEDEYAGLMLAQEYQEDIKASINEERGLKNEMKEAAEAYRDGNISRTGYNQFVEEAEKSLRENKIDRIEAYRNLRAKMLDMMAGSVDARKEFTEREKQRVEEIHHLANSDMQGEDASPFKEPTRMGRFANSSIVRFFSKPLITFDQMLRLFGQKNVAGEGYLFNKFHRGWIDATEKAYLGDKQAKEELDAKVSEVFDKKMRWSDLYAEERKMPTVKVKWWDGGQMKEHELTQGNLLYIYMVNKMTDGRMKLRRMGITDEHVEAIKKQMDERFIELADWLQSEYLVNKRNKYNAVHERLFGASMAAIEDYFPLKINKRSLNRAEDIGRPELDDALPATTTGSIIKRKRNAQDLDLLGADAFSVVIEHIEQMEQWAAFAEFNKDLNTLLSYKRFRNQVQNMDSVYGSGNELWKNFKSVCRIAGGTYNPAGKKSDLDTAALNIAKGVTSAKISFRIYTALKQFLSMPAFVSDANPKYLAQNLATPWKAWNWAMENLPMYEKRWKSRMVGDTRLMNTESDWKFFRSKVYDTLSRLGMSPNAFVDAMTIAIGSHSMYQTRYDRYIQDGYTEEQADKKAKQDATTLYNETQQSNEAAFVSPVQLDRTVLATMLTVFRNSSMGYQRQLHDAIRNIGKMMKPGYKAASIEFMTKQMVRDGLTEEQAEHAANRSYNREIWRSAARIGTFGFLVQFAWNLGGSIAYLLFGDDDDKKEEMLTEALIHGLIGGSMEGLAGGNVISEALNMVAKGESLNNYDPSLLPIISDMKSAYKKMSYDPVAGANDLVNLAVQAGLGVNPQTLTDAVVAVVDACGGDLETSTEAMLLIMRVLQVPQSQVDQIYIDELGVNADKARTMSAGEMAERYAKYKVAKGAPLTGWAYSDEAEEKREKAYLKRFKKLVKERKESK